ALREDQIVLGILDNQTHWLVRTSCGIRRHLHCDRVDADQSGHILCRDERYACVIDSDDKRSGHVLAGLTDRVRRGWRFGLTQASRVNGDILTASRWAGWRDVSAIGVNCNPELLATIEGLEYAGAVLADRDREATSAAADCVDLQRHGARLDFKRNLYRDLFLTARVRDIEHRSRDVVEGHASRSDARRNRERGRKWPDDIVRRIESLNAREDSASGNQRNSTRRDSREEAGAVHDIDILRTRQQ